jgi:hypothetical protein
MNFTFLKTLLILNFLICLFSCKAKSVTDSTKAKSAESIINTKNLSKQKNKSKHQDSEIKATFQIESSENEELGSPFSKISVRLNDKLIFIKDIQGEATEFNKDDLYQMYLQKTLDRTIRYASLIESFDQKEIKINDIICINPFYDQNQIKV